jgi:hypothetical protein
MISRPLPSPFCSHVSLRCCTQAMRKHALRISASAIYHLAVESQLPGHPRYGRQCGAMGTTGSTVTGLCGHGHALCCHHHHGGACCSALRRYHYTSPHHITLLYSTLHVTALHLWHYTYAAPQHRGGDSKQGSTALLPFLLSPNVKTSHEQQGPAPYLPFFFLLQHRHSRTKCLCSNVLWPPGASARSLADNSRVQEVWRDRRRGQIRGENAC